MLLQGSKTLKIQFRVYKNSKTRASKFPNTLLVSKVNWRGTTQLYEELWIWYFCWLTVQWVGGLGKFVFWIVDCVFSPAFSQTKTSFFAVSDKPTIFCFLFEKKRISITNFRNSIPKDVHSCHDKWVYWYTSQQTDLYTNTEAISWCLGLNGPLLVLASLQIHVLECGIRSEISCQECDMTWNRWGLASK